MTGVRRTNSGVVQASGGVARTLGVIDDYETDLSDYSFSTASNFSLDAAAAFNETSGVLFDASASDYGTATSGLAVFPSGGETYRSAVRTNDTSPTDDGTHWVIQSWMFGGSDQNNNAGYEALWKPGNGDLVLRERDSSGTVSALSTSTVYAASDDEWVEFEIDTPADPTTDSITAEIIANGSSQGTVSATASSDLTSNDGFGFRMNTNGASVGSPTWHYDYARLV